MYVVAGVVLGALGVYPALVDWAGAGATVPLTGFGNTIAEGVSKAVAEKGLIGALSGGLTAASAGITAAIVLSSSRPCSQDPVTNHKACQKTGLSFYFRSFLEYASHSVVDARFSDGRIA